MVGSWGVYSSDAQIAAVVSSVDRTIQVWDLASGQARPALQGFAPSQGYPLLGLSAEITLQAVLRKGDGARFLDTRVIAEQQRIADTFATLKLIPKPVSIAEHVWTPPAQATVARTAL